MRAWTDYDGVLVPVAACAPRQIASLVVTEYDPVSWLRFCPVRVYVGDDLLDLSTAQLRDLDIHHFYGTN